MNGEKMYAGMILVGKAEKRPLGRSRLGWEAKPNWILEKFHDVLRNGFTDQCRALLNKVMNTLVP
jgi:hypothetical protein